MHCFSPFPLPQIVRPAWDVGFSLPRSLDCLMVGASLCGLLKQEQTRFDQALTPLPRPSDQRNKRLAHPPTTLTHTKLKPFSYPPMFFFVMQSFTAGLMRSLLILSNLNGIYVLVICCSVCYYPPPSALYNSHPAPCASKSNPHSSLAPSASGVH